MRAHANHLRARAFAPVPDLWRAMGADGTGRDAREAVLVAERILTARREPGLTQT